MTKAIMILFASLFMLSSAWAACEYPDKSSIKVPDGNTATRDEMIQAMQQVKTYIADMNDYLTCLDEETAKQKDPDTGEIPKEAQAMNVKQHNAAVDEMEETKQAFNEQLHAFNEKNKK